MKKTLLSLLTMMVVSALGFTASAQDWSFTVNWNHPGAVKVLKGSSLSTAETVGTPSGATSVTLTEAAQYYFVANEGFVLDSAELGGQVLPASPVGGSDTKGFDINAGLSFNKDYFNGKTLTITARENWETTIAWNAPGSVKVLKGTAYASATPVEIADDATSVTLTEATGYFVVAADGYALTAASLEGTAKTIGLVDYTSGVKGVSIRAQYPGDKNAYNGKTLTVTTEKLVYKPFSLEVANGAASLVFKFYKDGSEVSSVTGVTDGMNNLEFPTIANQLYVQTSTFPRKALYSVKLGDEEQPEANTLQHYYLVSLAEGCQVYVAATDPGTAEYVDVTFRFTNNNPTIVNTIRDWANNKFIYPDEFGATGYKLTLLKGSDIQFNWNPEATITGLTANGTAVDPGTGSTRITVNETTEFAITGSMTEYAEHTVQIYAVGSEYLHFTANGEPLELTFVKDVPAGTMCGTVEIPTDAQLFECKVAAKPNAGVEFYTDNGYFIKKALRGTLAGSFTEAQDRTLSGTSKIDLVNCPLYIAVQKINYTDTLNVYYQGVTGGDAVLQSKFDGMNVPFIGDEHLKEGWNTIIFDPDYNTDFAARINIASDGSTNEMVKTVALNGTPLKADDNDLYNFQTPENNSVLKMFFTATAPVPYYVTFEKGGYAPAKVTYDMGKELPAFDESTRITAYGPTPMAITPGANVNVKQDGTPLTPENGVINITLTKKATISFEMDAANEAEIGTLDLLTGSVTRNLNKVTLKFPFDGEHSLDMNMDAIKAITLTPKAAAENAIHPLSIEPGEPSDTDIPLVINFPEVTEAGVYTLDIPAGVFFQTAWDEVAGAFTFQSGCKVNAAMTAEYTVDPNKAYEFTFTPANGSEGNEINPVGTIVTISVPDAESLVAPENTELGPWIEYGDNSLVKVEDALEETGWSWLESAKRNEVRILISAEVVKTAGELRIKADEGAFTIDGTASPAINYSAKYGEEKEYQVVSDPEGGTDVTKFDTITLTYVDATSLEFGEYFEMMLAQGWSYGVHLSQSDVTIEGNKLIITVPEEASASFKPGFYSLSMDEGSLIIDGKYPSTPLHMGWNLIRTSEVSQEWTPTPTGAIVNYGYGVEAGIAFGELESVGRGENYSGIEIYYDDVKVNPYVEGTEELGYLMQTGSSDYPNVLMISVYYSPTDKDGKLKVVIPAGALTISGEALAEPIEHTWDVLMQREYAYQLSPAADESVKELATVTVTFPDAESAELSEFFNNGWAQLKQSYMVISSASGVKAVEGAEHPTFEITFEKPATAAGTYTFKLNEGAFLLDTAFESPEITASYTVDPTLTGVNGIYAEDGLYTVTSVQGIVLMRDADFEKVKALPEGIYIINGTKVFIGK